MSTTRRYTLRIPEELAAGLETAAATDQRTVYTTINRAIEFYLAQHDQAEEYLRRRHQGRGNGNG